MLSSIKNTLTSAPGRIYNKAAETVNSAKTKVGEFHNRAVAPRVTAAKEGIVALKDQIKAKYHQRRGPTPESQNKDAAISGGIEAPTKSFEASRKDLYEKLYSDSLSSSEDLTKEITALAVSTKNVSELAEALVLLDSSLSSLSQGSKRLESFHKDLSALPFIKKDLKEQLENALALQQLSFNDFHPELKEAVENAMHKKFFPEMLEKLKQLEIKDLSSFLLSNKEILSYNIENDTYPLDDALSKNPKLSAADTDQLIYFRNEVLKGLEGNGSISVFKNAIDSKLLTNISSSIKKIFQDPLPSHLSEAFSSQLKAEPKTYKAAIQLFQEYYNTNDNKGVYVDTDSVMRKLQSLNETLFEYNSFKAKNIEFPQRKINSLYAALGEIEEKIPALKQTSTRAIPDPITPFVKALLKDVDAAKIDIAQGLGMSTDQLLATVKSERQLKRQYMYHQLLNERLPQSKYRPDNAFIKLAENNDIEGLKKAWEKFFRQELGNSFKNPFSKDGEAPICFGSGLGELELKVLPREGQETALMVEFTSKISLDETQENNILKINVPLRYKAPNELEALKQPLVDKNKTKYDEKMQELALLQFAAERGRDIDSNYDLESLKKTLINQEMQSILNDRLEYQSEIQKETNSPADRGEKSTKSILKPYKNNAKADDLIYAEAKDQATQKVEAELTAYIEKNQASLQEDYTKKVLKD